MPTNLTDGPAASLSFGIVSASPFEAIVPNFLRRQSYYFFFFFFCFASLLALAFFLI
ncbi:MAG: hypothetical protein AAF298_03420 [Cyanobacteria bacterium P01_A01_bin.40]